MSCQPYNQGVSVCVELAPPHNSKKVKNVQVVSELDHIKHGENFLVFEIDQTILRIIVT